MPEKGRQLSFTVTSENVMKGKITKQFVITIILIFVLQALMLVYIFGTTYKKLVDDVMDIGSSNLDSRVIMIENYLDRGGNTLWLAADTVDYMMEEGIDDDEMLKYLTRETANMQHKFDANFTGIYGTFGGVYIDGAGWTPEEGYDPTVREWYQSAVKADHEVVISKPYVDAQTGEIVVSFSKLLSDGVSVISMDIILNEVQRYVEEIDLGGSGYAFVIDSDGTIIAHDDRMMVGHAVDENGLYSDVIKRLPRDRKDVFSAKIEGQNCTVFSSPVEGEWTLVIIAFNSVLFHNTWIQFLTGMAISCVIFLVIALFCVFSVRRISDAEKNERHSMDRLSRMNMGIIRSLATAIDAKDRYTSGHSQRVADYAVRIARKMGKSEQEIKTIAYTGLLHDVGKIRVPVDVINKPGKLTEEEFEQIRIHPVSGYHILKGVFDDEQVRYGAKYHHERYDGRGYPNGIEGENIPEIARIIAVADAYDAMASNRSYRKALPQQVVRSEIEKGRGTQFDPNIADIMLSIIDEDTGYVLKQERELKWNILIVDDEVVNIKVVKRILKDDNNLCLFEAMTPEKVFSIMDEQDISLILMDLYMPGIDGFTLYKQVMQKKKIPVIMMTADRSGDTIRKIREYGIDDYLTKPLSALVLQETIHGVLHGNIKKI